MKSYQKSEYFFVQKTVDFTVKTVKALKVFRTRVKISRRKPLLDKTARRFNGLGRLKDFVSLLTVKTSDFISPKKPLKTEKP